MTEQTIDLAAEERERRYQAEGEKRIGPYLEALHGRIAQVLESVPLNMGDLTLILPREEWNDFDAGAPPGWVLGIPIVFADVPTIMVGVPVPKERAVTVRIRAEEG